MARNLRRTAALCLCLCLPAVALAQTQIENVAIRSMTVRAAITGPVAVNTLEFVLVNYRDQPADASMVLQLPEEAAMQDMALWVGGLRSPAELLPRLKAESIYREITAAKRDPALLTFLGRGKWSLQVSPIAARGTQKVQVVYTSLLRPGKGTMVYRAPTLEGGLSPAVQELDFSATIRGGVQDIKAIKPDLGVQRVTGGFNVGFRTEKPDLNAPGEFAIVDKTAGDTIWQGDTFAAFLPLPKFVTEAKPQARNYVLVVDVSQSMQKSSAKVRKAISAILEGMAPKDQFTIVAVSSDVKLWKDKLVDVNKGNLDQAAEFVKSIKFGGGTDLAAALRAVDDLNKNKDQWLEVVILSDGDDRVGLDCGKSDDDAGDASIEDKPASRPASAPASQGSQPSCLDIRPPANCRFYTIGANGRSKIDLINAFDAEDYSLGDIKGMMEDSHQPKIESIAVEVPKGTGAQMGTAMDEDSIAVVGRWPAELTKPVEVTVTATVDRKPITEKYQIQPPPATRPAGAEKGAVDSLQPVWASLWAQKLHRDLVQDDEPKLKQMEELIDFSKKWHIATPATAFLVLETPEDYLHRGLKREVSLLKEDQTFMGKTQEAAQAHILGELSMEVKQQLDSLRLQAAELTRMARYGEAAEALERIASLDNTQVEAQARAGMLRELDALCQAAANRKTQKESKEEISDQAMPWHYVFLADQRLQLVPMLSGQPRKVIAAAPAAPLPIDAAAIRKMETQIPKMEFANLEFQSVIDLIRTATKANIKVNWAALQAATIDKTTPVSMNAANITGKKALLTILKDLSSNTRVTYVIDDGVVQISTADDLARNPVIRTYDVRDLIQHAMGDESRRRSIDWEDSSFGSGPFSAGPFDSGGPSPFDTPRKGSSTVRLDSQGDPNVGGETVHVYDVRDLTVRVPNFAGPRINLSSSGNNASGEDNVCTRASGADVIVRTITETIDKETWVPTGTIGTIREIGGILVVTQTLENQVKIADLINTLKDALRDAELPATADEPQPTESLFTSTGMITQWAKNLLIAAGEGKLSKYSSVKVKKVGSVTLARIGGYWIDTRLTTADRICLLSPSSEAMVAVLRANEGLQDILALGPAIVQVGPKYAISLDAAGYRSADEPEVKKLLEAMKKG